MGPPDLHREDEPLGAALGGPDSGSCGDGRRASPPARGVSGTELGCIEPRRSQVGAALRTVEGIILQWVQPWLKTMAPAALLSRLSF